MVWSGWFRCFL